MILLGIVTMIVMLWIIKLEDVSDFVKRVICGLLLSVITLRMMRQAVTSLRNRYTETPDSTQHGE